MKDINRGVLRQERSASAILAVPGQVDAPGNSAEPNDTMPLRAQATQILDAQGEKNLEVAVE